MRGYKVMRKTDGLWSNLRSRLRLAKHLCVFVYNVLPFSDVGRRRFGYCMILIAWTIVIASALDPLFENSRGLDVGGPLTNNITFFLFYIGAPLVMIPMAIVAYKALWSAKAE